MGPALRMESIAGRADASHGCRSPRSNWPLSRRQRSCLCRFGVIRQGRGVWVKPLYCSRTVTGSGQMRPRDEMGRRDQHGLGCALYSMEQAPPVQPRDVRAAWPRAATRAGTVCLRKPVICWLRSPQQKDRWRMGVNHVTLFHALPECLTCPMKDSDE